MMTVTEPYLTLLRRCSEPARHRQAITEEGAKLKRARERQVGCRGKAGTRPCQQYGFVCRGATDVRAREVRGGKISAGSPLKSPAVAYRGSGSLADWLGEGAWRGLSFFRWPKHDDISSRQ